MNIKNITILGIGNVLFSDEGIGIRIIENLINTYTFSSNISVVDGGTLGLSLIDIISNSDKLIVVDAIKKNEQPGYIHRIENEEIADRIRAKNSLHQIDFLETLTLCQILDKNPETIIIGVEPQDIETFKTKITSTVFDKINKITKLILLEIDHTGPDYYYNKIKNPKKITPYWKER